MFSFPSNIFKVSYAKCPVNVLYKRKENELPVCNSINVLKNNLP